MRLDGVKDPAFSHIKSGNHAPSSPALSETGSAEAMHMGAANHMASAAQQNVTHLLQQLLDPEQVRKDIIQRETVTALKEVIARQDYVIAVLTQVNLKQQQLLASTFSEVSMAVATCVPEKESDIGKQACTRLIGHLPHKPSQKYQWQRRV